ncbi:MAG TPA: RNA polymerase sigma factor [Steroidobacteraceae bacterium]|nr:RNA polymerase sigma factor [Steroidobacteraceae bacterium]
MADVDKAQIERIFREEYGRVIAVLVKKFRSIELAEEAVQDAFVTAMERWPSTGLPPSPVGWIITTARNRAIDRVRRESKRDERHTVAALLTEQDADEDEPVSDDRLLLMFTCCHPALAITAQVALTLRLLGGLNTTEIARAFLVPEPTMAQRIVRAKAKIRDAGIPYRVPDSDELPVRLRSVLSVLYLIFNEGYSASSGQQLIRDDLCDEAIRLARALVELVPRESEAVGLLALLLLMDARRTARVAADGTLLTLTQQNRRLWKRSRIDEGQRLVRECLERANQNQDRGVGPYQIQAAINAVHSDAADIGSTDWGQILALYDQWFALAPSPVVALNRAVALAEIEGAAAALRIVDALDLSHYYLFHAIRADLLKRLGRNAEATVAYDAAIERSENLKEREFLRDRKEAMQRDLE